MNRVWDRILGLKDLSTADGDVHFEFARSMPAWGWVLAVLALGLLAYWSYWRLLGSRGGRTALGIARWATLGVVAVLIAGPQLVKQNERVERDWVLVLVDRSASLSIADAPSPAGTPTTRDEQLRAALSQASDAIANLRQNRQVLGLGFDSGVFELEPSASRAEPFALGTPTGTRTALGAALEQAMRRAAARPVAGVVLLSDGRSSDAASRALLQEMIERQVGVYAVALGSATPIPDVTVARVEAPPAAFVGDLVPVAVQVDRLGASPDGAPTGGKVQLLNEAGDVLTEQELPAGNDASTTVRLLTKALEAGDQEWSVRVVPDGPDLAPENNSQRVRVELADRPVRVAHFDGYPRWEFRYLKNLLLRERLFRSASVLLAADRRYIQEGAEHLDSLPRTAEEWARFDVVIMGDVRPGLLNAEQLVHLREAVAQRGLGLLWIAGPSFTPTAWQGTPLADLLPFGLSTDGAGPQTYSEPVLLRPGAAAQAYGVLQLGDDENAGWPSFLSEADRGWNTFRWAQRIDPASLKPAAEVLALAWPVGSDPALATPLMLSMRYGVGRVVYVATDETWRYRYGRGETLTERLWVPLVRLLARGSLGRSGKPAMIEVSPPIAMVQQPVRVTVRLLDQSLVERQPPEIVVQVVPADGEGPARAIALKPEAGAGDSAGIVNYGGLFIPDAPGRATITSDQPVLAGLDLKATVDVIAPEDEMRLPQTDHGNLRSLVDATGGQMLTAGQLADLPRLLPNREVRVLGTPDIETLWDKPLVWIVLMTLLSAEWIGRRLLKLS